MRVVNSRPAWAGDQIPVRCFVGDVQTVRDDPPAGGGDTVRYGLGGGQRQIRRNDQHAILGRRTTGPLDRALRVCGEQPDDLTRHPVPCQNPSHGV
jgi:hypothetical protein